MATKARRPETPAAPGPGPKSVPGSAKPTKSTGFGLAPAKSMAHGLGKSVSPPTQIMPIPSTAKPTPIDFDLFVPWLSLLWEVPYIVTVTRELQGKCLLLLSQSIE